MLVLQKEKIENGVIKEWHPVERFLERVDSKERDAAKLFKVISEINLYLPNDWRLTKNQNEFSILVVPASGVAYKLAGLSYRTENDSILHIINTVLCKHFHDKDDWEKFNDAPNLYYFQSCPEDSLSPLFARQYEKVKKDDAGNKSGTKYHRVHPLHKWGLDLDHYKWIKWDTNGNAEWVDYPDADYHGEDYWNVPMFQGNKSSYIKLFDKGMKKFNVVPPALPAQTATSYEKEFKLLVQSSEQHPNTTYKSLKELVKQHPQFNIECENKECEQSDVYFDDANFTLFNLGASFRFRKTPKSARVTLKSRPCAHSKLATKTGEYQRIEEEMTITRSQEKMLMNGEHLTALPYRLIAYVAPDCGIIKPVVSVRTKRKLIQVNNMFHQTAEICFDIVEYVALDGNVLGSDVEIEIESKGMPRDDVEILALYVKDDLKLIPTDESKYERAIALKIPIN